MSEQTVTPPKPHAVAHITPEMIAKIRALAAEGIEGIALARRFSCSPTTISRIVNHRWIWK
jgi:hypothetical protein